MWTGLLKMCIDLTLLLWFVAVIIVFAILIYIAIHELIVLITGEDEESML